MTHARPSMLAACAALVASAAPPAAAQPQQPAFNCAKAQGEVEKLVCSDAALAALDRRLDEVYKAAAARAKGSLAPTLRQEQRGWVKGRNECWKSNGQETWITATWTVKTVPACVDAQYRLRTSQLQAEWRLLPPRTVSYACQNNPANEIVVNYFASDPPTLRLERGDRTHTLWRVGAADAGTYEGQNVSLLQQGDVVKLSRLDTNTGKTEELQCQAR